MTFIIVYFFLLAPLMFVGMLIGAHNKKAKDKLPRRQNDDDMKKALAQAAEASGGCGYSGKMKL